MTRYENLLCDADDLRFLPVSKVRIGLSKTKINALPPTLLDHVRSYLSFQDMHKSRCVCKSWQDVSRVSTSLEHNSCDISSLPSAKLSWGKIKRAKIYKAESKCVEYILSKIHEDIVCLDIFACKTQIRFHCKGPFFFFLKLRELRVGNCHPSSLHAFLSRAPNLVSLRLINSFNPLLSSKIPILHSVRKLRFMCVNSHVATNPLLQKLPNLVDCHLKVFGEVDMSHNKKLQHLTHTGDQQSVNIEKWNLPSTMREISLPCLDEFSFYRAIFPLLQRIKDGSLKKLICSTILLTKAVQFFIFPEQIHFRTFDDHKISQPFVDSLAEVLKQLREDHNVPIKVWPLQDDQTQILSASCLGSTKLFNKREIQTVYDVGNRTSPCGHFMQEIEVANTHSCDTCGAKFKRFSRLYGCRSCNFDLCSKCFHNSDRCFQIKPYPDFNSVYIYNLFPNLNLNY